MAQPVVMIAKQVFYSGRVQGVGFRYTARQVAGGFDVTGWVRNLPDGRVEMQVMAGDPDELDAFLAELQQNSAVAHYIKETEVHPIAPPAGVTGFTIRRD